MHIALLTDYSVVSFACGPSLATQSLKRYLEGRGHKVTIVGPKPPPDAPAASHPSLLLEAAPYPAHRGVQLPFAWPPQAFDNKAHRFDVVHSHSNSLLMHWAPMMRAMYGIPCLSTNTIYLPGFAQYALPQALYKMSAVRDFWSRFPSKAVEASFAKLYNAGDGLIVQCPMLARYWNEFGLDVPVHVIPRPIDASTFDAPRGADPFKPTFRAGKRLLVVARHAREKSLDKVISAFAHHVLPRHPDASLTMIGDGEAHSDLVRLARQLGVMASCHFPGEKGHRELPDFYAYADIFAYASVTETYGQVISEALWCGTPVVALDDDMGVAFQVKDEHDGLLVAPGSGELTRLGDAIDRLLSNPDERAAFGSRAAARARHRVAPDVVYGKYEAAYRAATEHLRGSPPAPFKQSDWFRLMNRHVMPWTVQQSLLLALGTIRGKVEPKALAH